MECAAKNDGDEDKALKDSRMTIRIKENMPENKENKRRKKTRR